MINAQDNVTQIFGLSKFYGGTGEIKFYSTLVAAVRAFGKDLVLEDHEKACIRVFNMAESTGGPSYADFHDHEEIVAMARMSDDLISEIEADKLGELSN
jgi:hypothetical protein